MKDQAATIGSISRFDAPKGYSVRIFVRFCTAMVVGGLGSVLAQIPSTEVFDPEKPPLPEIGKRYRLMVHPGKGLSPVTLILVSGTESYGEEQGRQWTNIAEIEQSSGPTLPIENQAGVPHLELVDYDGDGALDFRILDNWGTGGSWYQYFRYAKGAYRPWDEPANLGINYIDPQNHFASARARSGPSWGESRYFLKDGHFTLYETETYDQAKYLRGRVSSVVPDSHYVHIVESIKDGRIVYRKIFEMNPWENEGTERIVFEGVVDELMPNKEE